MNMMVYIVQHNFPPHFPEGPVLAPRGSEGRDIPVNNSYHSRVMCNARTQSWLVVDEESGEENFQNFQSPTMKNDLIIDGMFASHGSPAREKKRREEKREHHFHANDH